MTHFIVYALDKDGGAPIRAANRDAHLAFLRAKADVKVCVAGPVLDDGQMIGSLLIVEADNESTVHIWLKTDPYGQAGLSKSVTVHPYKWVIGAPDIA